MIGSACAADLPMEVARCWNVDPSSRSAKVAVTVRFSLTDIGQPEPNSITLVGAYSQFGLYQKNGQIHEEVETAFQAARRAILRCRPDLSSELNSTFELTFDPQAMRWR